MYNMYYGFRNINISISAAILITGGDVTQKSAEIFLPGSNTSCQLPSLPDKRFRHVQAGLVLCGGLSESTRRSCLKWNVQHGRWATPSVRLSEIRWNSCIWAHDDELVLMGGYSAEWTSEIVSSDGAITRSSFSMGYKTK